MFQIYQHEVKDFIKRSAVFILPILIILAVFDLLAISLGELTSIRSVIVFQNNQPNSQILFGRKVVDQELRQYKYYQSTSRPSSVLALGSSRILQMRQEDFSPYCSFINVGTLAHNLGDVSDFAARLATTTDRRTIFLSLDYYWFGDKRQSDSSLTDDLAKADAVWQWRSHLQAVQYLVFTLFSNPDKFFSYLDYSKQDKISFGFQAQDGNGFRSDGSYQYGSFLSELRRKNVFRDREQPPMIDRIRQGSSQFAFGSKFDQARADKLSDVLKELKQKNYYVVGFGLPVSSEIYHELTTSPNHRQLFADFRNKIPKVFVANSFRFFDYSDLQSIGLSDLNMFDGFHPTETAIATVLVDSLEHLTDEEFAFRSEILSQLRETLADPKSTSFELVWSSSVYKAKN